LQIAVLSDSFIVTKKGKPIERWGRKVSGLRGESSTIAGLLGELDWRLLSASSRFSSPAFSNSLDLFFGTAVALR